MLVTFQGHRAAVDGPPIRVPDGGHAYPVWPDEFMGLLDVERQQPVRHVSATCVWAS